MPSILRLLSIVLLAIASPVAAQDTEKPTLPLECYFAAAGPARVIDGDTLEVPSCWGHRIVRLVGIDAPERGELGAGEATAALRRLMLPSGTAWCVCERGQRLKTSHRDCDTDRYGRIIAVCTNADRRDVAQALIRAGLARSRYGCQYAAEHRAACADKLGLWATGGNCTPQCEWKRNGQ